MSSYDPEDVLSINLKIKIIEGRDLIAKDRSLMGKRTTSDPYVEVFFGGKSYGHKTEVIPKTLDPKWNANLKILLMDKPQIEEIVSHEIPIRLVVWDKDLALDDCMGVIDIPLKNEDMEKPKWFPVEKGEDKVYDKNQFKQYCHNAKGDLKLQYTLKIKTKKDVYG